VKSVFIDLVKEMLDPAIGVLSQIFSSFHSFVIAAGLTHFCYSCPEIASHQKFVSFQLRLDDNESKVGLGVHVSRHIFNLFNLRFDLGIDPLKQAICRPSNTQKSKLYDYERNV
jgi:hypothetical protein